MKPPLPHQEQLDEANVECRHKVIGVTVRWSTSDRFGLSSWQFHEQGGTSCQWFSDIKVSASSFTRTKETRVSPCISTRSGVSAWPRSGCIPIADGRQLGVPLAYFPRLLNATPEQRCDYAISGGGVGIHWDVLDEDISVEGLLAGRGDLTTRNRLAA